MIQKDFFEEDMGIQSFKTIIISISKLPLGNSGKKCHLDVAPLENHRIYYRKKSSASS
jgi:hypothetical protein